MWRTGPAMTWMVHSIAYGDIGEDDKAAVYFQKSYDGLVRSPFFVWHEGFNEFGGGANASVYAVHCCTLSSTSLSPGQSCLHRSDCA